MTAKPKYVEIRPRKTMKDAHIVRINGRGRSIELHSTPGTDEYDAEYYRAREALKTGWKPRDKRVRINGCAVSQLLYEFETSKDWYDLAATSRKTYKTYMKLIDKRFGATIYDDLTRKDLLDARNDLSNHTGRQFISIFKRIINWGIEQEIVAHDVTLGIKARPRPKSGFPPWQDYHLSAFKKYWPVGTQERLAFDLLNNLGMRVADIIELGPQHLSDGYINKVCQKNKVKVTLPVSDSLARSIEATPHSPTTFLKLPNKNAPFEDSNYFGTWFKKACRKAGLYDLDTKNQREVTAHGLRKTVTLRGIKNKATRDQSKALQAWIDTGMVDYYGKEFDREQLGRKYGHLIHDNSD